MLVEHRLPPERLVLSPEEASWFLDVLERGHFAGSGGSDWLPTAFTWEVSRVVLVLPPHSDDRATLIRLAALLAPRPDRLTVLLALERGPFSLDPVVIARSRQRRFTAAVARTVGIAGEAGLRLAPGRIGVLDARSAHQAGLDRRVSSLRRGVLLAEWAT